MKYLVLIALAASMACTKPSPFIPDLGSPKSRAAVFAAEMAKHPEAQCTTFDEMYVQTNGTRAIWRIMCSSGLQVAFYFSEKGVLEGAIPEGVTKRD